MRVEPARSVRIAVPAYDAFTDESQRSVAAGILALDAKGIKVEAVDVLRGCCYVDLARNILAGNFLRGTASDFIFIDADVGFDPESLVRLCEATRPVVAGIYPKKVVPPEWPVMVAHEQIWADSDGLIECGVVPTGFLRINRAVFDALKVPEFTSPDGQVGAYFQTAVRDNVFWGEDVEFCRLVREAGIPIMAFAEMDFRHVASDGRVYPGNWGEWLRSQMKEAA